MILNSSPPIKAVISASNYPLFHSYELRGLEFICFTCLHELAASLTAFITIIEISFFIFGLRRKKAKNKVFIYGSKPKRKRKLVVVFGRKRKPKKNENQA